MKIQSRKVYKAFPSFVQRFFDLNDTSRYHRIRNESILVNTRNYLPIFVRQGITKERGKNFPTTGTIDVAFKLKEKEEKRVAESTTRVVSQTAYIYAGNEHFCTLAESLAGGEWGGGTRRPETASGGISQASGELMARYCGASL